MNATTTTAQCSAPGVNCPYPATVKRWGLCLGHNARRLRGAALDVPVTQRVPRGLTCRVCLDRPAKAAGVCTRCDHLERVERQTHFDWVQVERAWAGDAPLPRRLTNPERLHLAWWAAKADGWPHYPLRLTRGYDAMSDTEAGALLRLSRPSALTLIRGVKSGDIRVMGRDWRGMPTAELLPLPR